MNDFGQSLRASGRAAHPHFWLAVLLAYLLAASIAPSVGNALHVPDQQSTADQLLKLVVPANPEEWKKTIFASLATLLVTLISFSAKRLWAAVTYVIRGIWNRLPIERLSEAAYRKKIIAELDAVQILQMAQPKSLRQFFLPLRVVRWTSVELRTTRTTADELVDLKGALERSGRIAILGDPGAGKTTLTSHAAARIADRSTKIQNRVYFPIYVHLRRLKDLLDNQSITLLEMLVQTVERYSIPKARKLVENRLRNGACLVVLDGFDEVSDLDGKKQLALSLKVNDFLKEADPRNRVVITSRTSSYVAAWFQRFDVYEVTELTLPQMETFVSGWFGADKMRWRDTLIAQLRENQRLQILTTNPLMLAILCFVFETRDPDETYLPNKRVDLYERCAEALIVNWDKSRGVDRAAAFTAQEIEAVLGHVAYTTLIQGKLEFRDKELIALVRDALPSAGIRQYKDEAFGTEVIRHTGLLKEKYRKVVSFIHLTFHEYFAATKLRAKIQQGLEEKNLPTQISDVLQNIGDPRWYEPVMLAAGMLRGRPEFVLALYEHYQLRPRPDFQKLLIGCLRDADLDRLDLDPEYMVAQDRLLSDLVMNVTGATRP